MKLQNWMLGAVMGGMMLASPSALGVDVVPRAGKMGPNFTCSLDLALAKDEPEVTIVFTRGFPTPQGWMLEDTMPGDDVAPATCFSREKPPPPDVIEALTREMLGVYTDRYNAIDRWSGSIGDPITITWSFVPDGTALPANPGAAGNSNLFARMDALFGAANRSVWISRFEQSFNRWAQLAGLRYTRVRSGTNDWDDGAAWGAGSSATRGMVRIGMRNVDGANGILAFNQFPSSGGDMVLDSSETWSAGGGSHLFLRNTIMHEHGHGIGLAHVCPNTQTKLMEPFNSSAYDGPQQDDIRAANDLYGDTFESNNTAATATALDPNTATTDLEPLTPGTTFNFGNTIPTPAVTGAALLSIDPNLDVDNYKFALTRSRLVTVTATPVGTSYTDVDQNQDGSCQSSGNTANALAAADLTLGVYNSTGSVSYGTIDDTNAGSPEVLTGVLVPAGTTTVRVGRVGAQTDTQLYRLSVQVSAANLTVTASDGTFENFVRLTWASVPNVTQYLISRSTTNSFITSQTIANGITGITYDDTSAVPGTTYFYWIRAQQNGSVRLVTDDPDSGFRPAPPACVADVDDGSGTGTPDGGVTIDDLLYYLGIYSAGSIAADVDDGSGTGTRDGGVTIDDLLYFLLRYEAGC
jgi:hypothetical protein